jgi:hypothetical protein
MTEKEWKKKSPEWQGAQWPRCKTCKHIAQSHDSHENEPQHLSCCEHVVQQCPTCDTHGVKIQCQCTGYVGPTFTELLESL